MNVWFGGFTTMCREMGTEFFDFFLDEMILMHNSLTFSRLEKKGFNPSYW